MKKQDILNMKTGKEIIQAILKHPELVDDEVSEYQKEVSKREHIIKYGDLETHVDLFKK